MTWQRIDENTYIDDTLVTCAEYQLFIDEMRKRGKYFQPDHWISYKFTKGHARDPILGVLLEDAKAFCDWLMEGENREWVYRLPTDEEANSLMMKPLETMLIGYWLDDGWAWIQPGAQKLYELALRDGQYVGPVQSLARSSTYHLAKNLFGDMRRDFDAVREFVYKLNNHNLTMEFLMCQMSLLGFDLGHLYDTDNYKKQNEAYRRVCKFRDKINLIEDYYNSSKFPDYSDMLTIGNFIQDTQAKARQLTSLLNLARALNRNLAYRRKLQPLNLPKLMEGVDTFQEEKLKNYVNSLQSRIDGRLPAIEGIRLVRERI